MQTLTDKTWIPLGMAGAIIVFVMGAVFWAATVQSDLAYVKRDVAEIKTIITRPDRVGLK